LGSTSSRTLQISIITFLNAATNAPSDLEIRQFIRKELDDNNFKEILKKITSVEEDDGTILDLEEQIKIYEDYREEDIKILKNRFHHLDDPNLNFHNVEDLYNKMKKIIDNKDLITEYFTELLRDVLGIGPGEKNFKSKWALITKVARQVSHLDKKK